MGKRPLITEKHVVEALEAGRKTQAVTPKTLINNQLTSAGLGAQIGPSAAAYLVKSQTSTSFRIYAITNALTNPQLVQATVTVPRSNSPASAWLPASSSTRARAI